MLKGFLAVVSLIVVFMCSTVSSAEPCKKEFKNLKLTKQEVQFLQELSTDKQVGKDFFKSALLFLALGELKNAPKTAKDLAQVIVKEAVVPVPQDTFARAVKGLQQLSAKPASDSLTLFLIGKHPKFKNYRPKGDSYHFFKCMQQRYYKLTISGNG